MNLTNPNTPVSQQDLKDLYEQKILPYIGGAFGLVATGIDSANLYSITERVVGQWIDGKPIYQKTVDCGALPNAGQSSVSHNIANIDIIPNFWGIGINQGGISLKIPGEVTGSNHASAVGCYVNRTEIGFLTYNDRSGYHAYVTIQYTKTTDSTVESYGTDTTYSTDEHVVGSWIDGRPVYQKTVNIGSLPNSGTKEIAHGITSLDKVISSGGIAVNSSYNLTIPRISSNSAYNIYLLAVTATDIQVNAPFNASDYTGYVTLQYTKTS